MIITASEAAEFLGSATLASSAPFVRLVAAADRFVKGYCGREFERAERTEYPRAYGSPLVWVKESPVAALAEVRIDSSGQFPAESVTDLASFQFDDIGRVFLVGLYPEGARTVMVKYTGGYYPATDTDPTHVPKMPEDLRAVALEIVARMHKRGPNEVMQSESLGAYSYTRFSSAISPEQKSILSHYKRW